MAINNPYNFGELRIKNKNDDLNLGSKFVILLPALSELYCRIVNPDIEENQLTTAKEITQDHSNTYVSSVCNPPWSGPLNDWSGLTNRDINILKAILKGVWGKQ